MLNTAALQRIWSVPARRDPSSALSHDQDPELEAANDNAPPQELGAITME